MRKSILACTVSLLMSPAAGWALGMGDVQVNSALNQPLNAEIAIHSVTKKDLDSLRVGLASKAVYSRAEIERSDYLSKFHFDIIQRNGKNYIAITTKKAFREPYANFLIEANWRSGRLLREYTMLLDPPDFIKKQARPVTTASASKASQVKRSYTKPTARKSTSKKAKSVNNNVLATSSVNSYKSDTGLNTGGLSYGPTAENDTLWSIAKKMAPAGISVNQMMMALLRDNPDAFDNNNINTLKEGVVLRIKDRNSLHQISRSDANQQAMEQNNNWQNLRQQKDNANVVDRNSDTAEQSFPDAQLKLVTSGQSEQAADGVQSETTEQLTNELALATESLESKELENQELQQRIKELEELVETKESLIELKDESLAVLQQQIQENLDAESDETAETIVEPESEVEQELEPEAVVGQEPVIEPEIISEPVVEAINESKPVAEEKPEPVVEKKPKFKPRVAPKSEESIVDILLSEEMLPYVAGGGGALVLLLGWFGYRAKNKKDNDFEESILDSHITDDTSNFDLGDSEIGDSEVGDLITEVSVSADNETSFLSDFSADDMESLQPDDTDSDPISEADVFMVYGRYQQAEELLQGVIATDPERLDYQMKLLEVHHGDKARDSFILQAALVKELLEKSDENLESSSQWAEVTSWAETLDIDLDSPDAPDETQLIDSDTLNAEIDGFDSEFVMAEEPSAGEKSSNDDDEFLTDELSLDGEEFNLDTDLSDSDSDDLFKSDLDGDNEFSLDDLDDDLISVDSNGDDFDLSLEEISSDSDDLESAFDLEDSDDLETSLELEDSDDLGSSFNLDDSLDIDTSDELESSLELNDSDALADSFNLDDSNEFEISLDLDDSLLVEGSLLAEDTLSAEGSLPAEGSLSAEGSIDTDSSFDLDDSFELDDDSDINTNLEAEASTDDDLDMFDVGTDFDDLAEDFPELDAVATKLDLAKAYVDMGDMDSAGSILNEVIDEGDDAQKAEAQALLDQGDS